MKLTKTFWIALFATYVLAVGLWFSWIIRPTAEVHSRLLEHYQVREEGPEATGSFGRPDPAPTVDELEHVRIKPLTNGLFAAEHDFYPHIGWRLVGNKWTNANTCMKDCWWIINEYRSDRWPKELKP